MANSRTSFDALHKRRHRVSRLACFLYTYIHISHLKAKSGKGDKYTWMPSRKALYCSLDPYFWRVVNFLYASVLMAARRLYSVEGFVYKNRGRGYQTSG